MNRVSKLIIFAVVAAAQLAAPAWMIGQREYILRNGTVYKFRTAPVDPYDAFRGRYVWLNFEENTATWPGPGPIPDVLIRGDKWVYAALTIGPDGFAKFTNATFDPPASGDYLRAHTSYFWNSTSPTAAPDRVLIILPFDRYYMNEKAAPEAERVYREHSNVKTRDAYATVRIWKGNAVLEGLYVADQRIEDFLANAPESPATER